MPLGIASARELEVQFEQARLDKLAAKMKNKKKPQLNSKAQHKLIQECAKRRYPNDPRLVSKFTDVATRM